MKQTGEEYRAKNKKRLQRYFQKHLSEGKKRITALIEGDVYQALVDHKDREGISINKAVEDALKVVYFQVAEILPEPDEPDPVQEPEKVVEILPQPIADNTDNQDPALVRALKLLEIKEQYPGRKNAKKRVEILNASDIDLQGVTGQWTTVNAKNAFLNAQKTVDKIKGGEPCSNANLKK